MRVLLTGGNGFVGSHILDLLRASGHDVALLLRRTSDTRFIVGHLPHVHVHYGSLADSRSLEKAMRGAHAVIHCAGKTKVLRVSEYYRVNHDGTRNVVCAVNACRDSVRHLVHISSLAVSGPGVIDRPARETDPPRPVSEYGWSKLRGEGEVTRHCQVPWTVLRPAAVYGPRDGDFLSVFQAVHRHIVPLFDGGKRALNLIHVQDVAESVRRCLGRTEAMGKVYHVAAAPPCTQAELLRQIATQMGVRPLRLHIPVRTLHPLCVAQEMLSRLRGRPNALSRDKLAEIRAPGWVCTTDRIRRDLGFVATTSLGEGVARTLEWYRQERWL